MKRNVKQEQGIIDTFGANLPECSGDERRYNSHEQEIKCLRGRLSRGQKMQGICSLAGNVAHEFNNILTPIIGYAELSIAQAWEPETVYYYQKQILAAAMRASNLASYLLAISREKDEGEADNRLGFEEIQAAISGSSARG